MPKASQNHQLTYSNMHVFALWEEARENPLHQKAPVPAPRYSNSGF